MGIYQRESWKSVFLIKWARLDPEELLNQNPTYIWSFSLFFLSSPKTNMGIDVPFKSNSTSYLFRNLFSKDNYISKYIFFYFVFSSYLLCNCIFALNHNIQVIFSVAFTGTNPINKAAQLFLWDSLLSLWKVSKCCNVFCDSTPKQMRWKRSAFLLQSLTRSEKCLLLKKNPTKQKTENQSLRTKPQAWVFLC